MKFGAGLDFIPWTDGLGLCCHSLLQSRRVCLCDALHCCKLWCAQKPLIAPPPRPRLHKILAMCLPGEASAPSALHKHSYPCAEEPEAGCPGPCGVSRAEERAAPECHAHKKSLRSPRG